MKNLRTHLELIAIDIPLSEDIISQILGLEKSGYM